MDSTHADELLRHARFARGLARGLLRDDSLADDAVQETWLAAVRRPPRVLSAAWIGAVARNAALKLRRGESRRNVRESAVASPEASGAAWSPERQAVIREVVDAVLALDEPMRSAVLMRFYEDLPPRVIAERQGVSVNTVNSRLQRALAALRERLDARDGGRGEWAVLLAPLGGTGGDGASRVEATGGAVSAAVEGGIVVALGTKVTVGAAALVVALGLMWWMQESGDAPRSPLSLGESESASAARPGAHRIPTERARVAAPASAPDTASSAPAAAETPKIVPDVAGTVEAPAGAALTDGFAYVAAGSGDARKVVARCALRDDGAFEMTLPGDVATGDADVEVGAVVPRLRRDATSVRLKKGATRRVTLRAAAGSSITGTVVTTDGVPLAGVKLLARPSGFDATLVTGDTLDTEALLAAHFDPDVQWARAVTDASGRFVLDGLGKGEVSIFSESPAWFLSVDAAVEAGARDVRIVARAAQSVTVRVKDAKTGAPIDCRGQLLFRRRTPGHGAASSRGVEVRRGELWIAWDREGVVEATVPAPADLPPGTVTASVRLEADGYQIREVPVALDGAAAQILDVELDQVVDAALGRVRLSVVDARGAPVDHEIETSLYEVGPERRSPATKRLSKTGPGKFVLAVSPGKWHLAVSAADASAGDIAARIEVEVVAGASSDVEVALPATGFVVVRRKTNEGALPELAAEAADVHGNSIRTSFTDAEFRLRLAVGRWTVRLGEGESATARDVDVRAFEEIVIETER